MSFVDVGDWLSVAPGPQRLLGLFSATGPPVPLRHRKVTATVECALGYADCTEVFHYVASEKAVSSTFKFPLPPKAAVYRFEATIDDRRVMTKVKATAEAQEEFHNAVQQGHSAVLMSQAEAGSIFTIDLGNLAAMTECVVHISYLQLLSAVAGALEFAHTATWVPPYVTASELARDSTGEQLKATTPAFATQVTYTLSYSIRVVPDAHGIKSIECIAPAAKVVENGAERVVSISEEVGDPSRDFTLLVELPLSQPTSQLSVQHCQRNGADKTVLLATFVPEPPQPGLSAGTLREVWFVVDCSGSMGGSPIAQAREAALFFVKDLPVKAGVTFNVVTFGSSHNMLYAGHCQPYDAASEKTAVGWINRNVEANLGGTEVLATLKAIYDVPVAAGYIREIVFLTDGGVSGSEEDKILTLIRRGARPAGHGHKWQLANVFVGAFKGGKEHGGSAGKEAASRPATSIFCLGIGHGVHRGLLDNMAAASSGVAQYVVDDEPIGKKCSFLRRCALAESAICKPRLVARSIALRPSPHVLPARLFPGDPIHILAEVSSSEPTATLEIQGELADGMAYISPPLALASASTVTGDALSVLHAMSYIGTLLNGTSPLHVKPNGEALEKAPEAAIVKEAIVRLALAENLVTPYTAAVGVMLQADPMDPSTVTTVEVPLQVPHGRTLFSTGSLDKDALGIARCMAIGSGRGSKFGGMPRGAPGGGSVLFGASIGPPGGSVLFGATQPCTALNARPQRHMLQHQQPLCLRQQAHQGGSEALPNAHRPLTPTSSGAATSTSCPAKRSRGRADTLQPTDLTCAEQVSCDDMEVDMAQGLPRAEGGGAAQPGTVPGWPREQVAAKAAALTWLNLLRSTEGSFPASEASLQKLADAVVAVRGEAAAAAPTAGALRAAAHEGLTDDQWMTVLVLSFLRQHLRDQRSIWEPMEAKALSWLASTWPETARSIGATTLMACKLL